MAVSDPAEGGFAVTPSDSATLSSVKALYVGGAGSVAVIFRRRSAAVTFVAVPAGAVLPVQVTKVLATGTTATDIIALV